MHVMVEVLKYDVHAGTCEGFAVMHVHVCITYRYCGTV
jgi:hypothetical protein